ncbi:MAG: zinc ribbon domain-containing protein [Lentisphaerae bacterium]|jgi:putative FmdB family regulatory protein|nr:zinc ribbon domain-containing protein [Lentisphaerota bacterium]MBT4818032.1 zinc ribbon domain-containing protein [Lentisphaerota bacterium]MBT5607595.1 zinc ribbon domain-containing protein [Lentisphaerota bacterium]MBT7056880.1 zinc ribbon domain-containing protein [Lentisphaerota bacterium]MBT7845216.1 zinc ribbon domain-containing protein [Lentisphaerota bacterium]
MPIYEYKCASCEAVFEHLHRTLSETAPPCPECGTEKPKKLFSSFAAVSAAPKSPCESGPCPAAGACPSRSPCASGGCPLTAN